MQPRLGRTRARASAPTSRGDGRRVRRRRRSTPETVDGPPDWRGLLDLLEDETGKDFTDLWRQWVVRPEEAALLDARAEARTAYVRTLALAGDWQLPTGIREAMRGWQFDEAGRQMADARTVLAHARRGRVARRSRRR